LVALGQAEKDDDAVIVDYAKTGGAK
jgi:hypothetical protein